MIRLFSTFSDLLDIVKPLLVQKYQLNSTSAYIYFSRIFTGSNFMPSSDLDKLIPPQKIQTFNAIILRLEREEPLAYILNNTSFYKDDFFITQDVLIPRPESELLVDLVLSAISKSTLDHLDLFEVGTGSGCLSISILKYSHKDIIIQSIDSSLKALQVANKNKIDILSSEKQKHLHFLHRDVFDSLIDSEFDIIFSNPPYVPTEEYDKLDRSLVNFEPRIAIDSGDDPFIFYRRLSELVNNNLKIGGTAFFEIHSPLSYKTMEVFISNCAGISCNLHKDLFGRERVLSIRKLLR